MMEPKVDDEEEDTGSVLSEPKIVSMFVFPFLSRKMVTPNENDYKSTTDDSKNHNRARHLRKYQKMLQATMNKDPDNDTYSEGVMRSRELMEDFRMHYHHCDNTVICQVLIPCTETFSVKDKVTGDIVQGSPIQKRNVVHLVRFEQVNKTHNIRNPKHRRGLFQKIFPYQLELGEWQITDIDDLRDGNLLL